MRDDGTPPRGPTYSAPIRVIRQIAGMLRGWQRRFRQAGSLYLWVVAILLGTGVGFAATGFHLAIQEIQLLAYGANDYTLMRSLISPAWLIIVIPVGAGLVVGVLLHWLAPDGRAHGMADVIRARDLTRGRVNLRAGVVSTVISIISLGGGASTGREGPVVHMGATLSSLIARFLRADETTSRTLLGCAAAAGVSALFNTPIAGTVFALEVILGSYSIRVFAPIVAASAAGTVVSRFVLGDSPAFLLAPFESSPLWQLPAFALLGVISALAVGVFARTIFAAGRAADRIQRSLHMPLLLRPAAAGLLLGVLGWMAPEVIGVGYVATANALSGNILWQAAMVVFGIKLLATAVSLAGRFGGGIFSPSVMLGALLGAAYAQILTELLPIAQMSVGTYALAGMAAFAAAMLGAPISTTLIAFELTGDYRTALAVMVTVSAATMMVQRFLRRGFFYEQLERSGMPLAGGRQAHLLRTVKVGELLRPFGLPHAATEEECARLVALGCTLSSDASLGQALELLGREKIEFAPVLSPTGDVLGAVFHSDALRIYNRAFAKSYSEEHDC